MPILTNLPNQFFRYVQIGLATNAVAFGSYLLLNHVGFGPLTAMTIAYCLGLFLAFLGNRAWTFGRSADRRATTKLRYLTACTIGYLFNFIALWWMVNVQGYRYDISQAILVILVAIGLFGLQRQWVFK